MAACLFSCAHGATTEVGTILHGRDSPSALALRCAIRRRSFLCAFHTSCNSAHWQYVSRFASPTHRAKALMHMSPPYSVCWTHPHAVAIGFSSVFLQTRFPSIHLSTAMCLMLVTNLPMTLHACLYASKEIMRG